MDSLKIYFAGDLFDHKHLIGNALLANYIERMSSNAYRCLLPQDEEQATNRRVSIRNQDLKAIIESDVGLFNFDGADLDSGTVVEFMVAKQLDIPVVYYEQTYDSLGIRALKEITGILCVPTTQELKLSALMAWNCISKHRDRISTRKSTLFTVHFLYP